MSTRKEALQRMREQKHKSAYLSMPDMRELSVYDQLSPRPSRFSKHDLTGQVGLSEEKKDMKRLSHYFEGLESDEKGVTVEDLVGRLFTDNELDGKYPTIIIISYPLFTTPIALLNLLLQKFIDFPSVLNRGIFFSFLQQWYTMFYSDFATHPELLQRLSQAINQHGNVFGFTQADNQIPLRELEKLRLVRVGAQILHFLKPHLSFARYELIAAIVEYVDMNRGLFKKHSSKKIPYTFTGQVILDFFRSRFGIPERDALLILNL